MKSPATRARPPETIGDRHSRVAMMGRMLKLSNMVMRPFYASFAERYSVNHNELRVLMTLAHMREAAAHEIAKAAGMYPMNVSRAVATLTRDRRISARPDLDGRRKILSLTPEGRALYEGLLPHVRYMADLLFETMTPLETEFFGKLLAKLVEHLDTAAQADETLLPPSTAGDPVPSFGASRTKAATGNRKAKPAGPPKRQERLSKRGNAPR